MHELNFISYEESRLEYFRAQKAHCERCLDYWVKALRKGKRGYCACNAVKTKRKSALLRCLRKFRRKVYSF